MHHPGGEEATDRLLESKQLLAQLHLKYEYEMQKLREFVKRETERHHAEMRRLEQEHDRELHVIYRDTSVIFRAVNRFKECLAVLLERESKYRKIKGAVSRYFYPNLSYIQILSRKHQN